MRWMTGYGMTSNIDRKPPLVVCTKDRHTWMWIAIGLNAIAFLAAAVLVVRHLEGG